MSRRWRRLSRITNLAVCVPARATCDRLREQRHLAALELHELARAPTAAASSARSGRSSGPVDAHREVEARRLLPRRVHVVDQVDAADERDAPVDVAELAVQPAQPVRAELPRRDLGPVLQEPHAAVAQPALEPLREVVLGAPAVDQHAHRRRRAAPRAPAPPRSPCPRVVGEDVGLEPDLALARASIAAVSAGKNSPPLRSSSILLPGVKRIIAGPRASGAHRRWRWTSNVAASAAWSDMRPDGNA